MKLTQGDPAFLSLLSLFSFPLGCKYISNLIVGLCILSRVYHQYFD
jgi:hypothetical protein